MAGRQRRPVRRLVFRYYAERYLLLLLVSFALSIAATRLFLEVTGYPQIGNSRLHLAHVLWGGLIWFAGSMFPLVFANKRAFDLSAILTGIGSGLFMDEVGKFITATNDYFHPAAAPIVYAFFLITILIFQLIRKQSPLTARDRLYRVIEQFEELIEGDLSKAEQKRLLEELGEIGAPEESEHLKELEEGLRKIVEQGEKRLIPHQPDRLERLANQWDEMVHRLFKDDHTPRWLFLLWFLLGIISVIHPVLSLSLLGKGIQLPWILDELLQINLSPTLEVRFFEVLRLYGEGLLGLVMLAAAGLGLLGKTRSAALIAFLGNLVMLVFVNLFVFYYDQFSAIIFAVVQFISLLLTNQYRRVLSEDAAKIKSN